MARIRMGAVVDTTVAELVADAHSTVTGLGEEFREMYDNAPESLQQTDVNQRRDETASAIESLSEPDVDEKLGALPAKFSPWQPARKGRGLSRADQAAEAVARLETAVEVLQEYAEAEGRSEEDKDAAESLVSDIEELRGEMEGLEFPGMFG